jgi:tRNA (Thr-GGU) A37 N-methylase
MRLPKGWHSVTPRIVIDDVAGLVEFLRQAFEGAKLKVGPLEAIHGTPVVDIKPVLSRTVDS